MIAISGWFETPTNTPTGARKKIAVDNPYVSKDEFINSAEAVGLNITNASTVYTSGDLDKKLLIASATINRRCNRRFDTQTIDETRTHFSVRPMNPRLVTVTLANGPYQSINSIYLQVLKWFIQIDVTPSGYLQDFPDYGYYKIVPMLSSAGSGVPLPAQIVDKVPLGVLWTNYTFGFGKTYTATDVPVVVSSPQVYTQYQTSIGMRLWAPDQTFNVYVNNVLQNTNLYTVDYPNGLITFKAALQPTDVVTADFTTNETVPAEIKQATILLTAYMLGQAAENPLGATSYSTQTYNVSFNSSTGGIEDRINNLLSSYVLEYPQLI